MSNNSNRLAKCQRCNYHKWEHPVPSDSDRIECNVFHPTWHSKLNLTTKADDLERHNKPRNRGESELQPWGAVWVALDMMV